MQTGTSDKTDNPLMQTNTSDSKASKYDPVGAPDPPVADIIPITLLSPDYTEDPARSTEWKSKEGKLWCGAETNGAQDLNGRVAGVQCLTCWDGQMFKVLCAFCAVTCHAGHDLSKPFVIGGETGACGSASGILEDEHNFCDCKYSEADKQCAPQDKPCKLSSVRTFSIVGLARDYFGPLSPYLKPLSLLGLHDGIKK
jgi:hypothetical protein